MEEKIALVLTYGGGDRMRCEFNHVVCTLDYLVFMELVRQY
jgi:hypothetical protein